MAVPQSPFERYLTQVLRELSALPHEQRVAITKELRGHLDDAAAARGHSSDDPQIQLAVIAELGSAQRLGRALARTHSVPQTISAGFLLRWTLLGVLGASIALVLFGLAAGNWRSSHTFAVTFFGSGMGAALFQTVLLRSAVAPTAHQYAISAPIVAGWLVAGALALNLPIEGYWEPIADMLWFVSLLVGGLLVGIGHWLALWRHMRAAWLWPLGAMIGLPVSLLCSIVAGIPLYVTGLISDALLPYVYGVIYATCYSMASGVVMLATAGMEPIPPVVVSDAEATSRSSQGTIPSFRGAIGLLTTMTAVALVVLLWTYTLQQNLPVVRADMTAEISAPVASLAPFGEDHVRVIVPDVRASLYVHEDHRPLLQSGLLERSEGPVTVLIYANDLKRLGETGLVRVLALRAGDTTVLDVNEVAVGRNSAEPVLEGLRWGSMGVAVACFAAALLRWRRGRARFVR